MRNKRAIKKLSSKYKGVSWDKQYSKWRAYIYLNGRLKFLGKFLSEEEAAISYNNAAKLEYGDFCHLNKIAPSAE